MGWQNFSFNDMGFFHNDALSSVTFVAKYSRNLVALMLVTTSIDWIYQPSFEIPCLQGGTNPCR